MIDRSHFLWEITYRLSGHVGDSLDKRVAFDFRGGGGNDMLLCKHPSRLCINQGGGERALTGKT